MSNNSNLLRRRKEKDLSFLIFGVVIFLSFILLMIRFIPPVIDLADGSFKTDLKSANAILISLDDKKVIAQKNSEKRIYPASLTKMMTAIVAVENLNDLYGQVYLSPDIFHNLYDASMAGFLPGEEVSAIDLLYGIMLPSGAECCIGIANAISGSEENFVKLMNEKAEEIGMKNTNFVNTTGLQDKNHYSTVKDLSLLLEYAFNNEIFMKIFSTFDYITSSTNYHPEGINLTSTLYKNTNDLFILNGEILGGKTGYTDEAGLCLASIANVEGKNYLLITAGAKGNPNSKQYNIEDALLVYNSIF